MSDDKELISVAEAVQRLPEGDTVHTFRIAGPCLVGADWDRQNIVTALEAAPEIQVTGPNAQDMGHGLAIRDSHGWLFIETKKQNKEQA